MKRDNINWKIQKQPTQIKWWEDLIEASVIVRTYKKLNNIFFNNHKIKILQDKWCLRVSQPWFKLFRMKNQIQFHKAEQLKRINTDDHRLDQSIASNLQLIFFKWREIKLDRKKKRSLDDCHHGVLHGIDQWCFLIRQLPELSDNYLSTFFHPAYKTRQREERRQHEKEGSGNRVRGQGRLEPSHRRGVNWREVV